MNQPVATRPPGPRFGISLGVLLVGLAAAIVGVVMLVSAFWQVVNGTAYAVPSVLRVHLGSGNYKIYELQRFGGGDGFRFTPPLVTTSTVDVTAPGGGRVPVSSTGGGTSETISDGDGSYTAVLRFHADSEGTYTIRVRTTAPTRVKIEHPLVDIAGDNLGWVLLIVGGGLVMLAGFVMVIVGLIRRGSAKRRAAGFPPAAPVAGSPGAWPPGPGVPPGSVPTPTPAQEGQPGVAAAPPANAPAAPAVAPAGWYPDPSGAHRLRYWDGRTWTEHIAD